jgi:hypothetical protein
MSSRSWVTSSLARRPETFWRVFSGRTLRSLMLFVLARAHQSMIWNRRRQASQLRDQQIVLFGARLAAGVPTPLAARSRCG